MKGRRITIPENGYKGCEQGDYFKGKDGEWYARPPWQGGLAWLKRHTVVEHEDGTITVSPSILVTAGTKDGAPTWHGFLERGIWREC